ncbi:MAG: AURKAIP1/COX24 domain-containing protein [Nitrospirae bacterium]|nr:AURKAIP1/COX24 domain-containing protein [Nitrospirota bacterium]MBI3605166.1 AURKAIP1/COX24 domain-containing protein [Nitrospirota bacterium]
MSRVVKKRRKKMRKHKHKKLLKRTRTLRKRRK